MRLSFFILKICESIKMERISRKKRQKQEMRRNDYMTK